MTDSDFEHLIPAIRSGKVKSLRLMDNQITGTCFEDLVEAMQDPKSQLQDLVLCENPLQNDNARLLAKVLENPNKEIDICLSDTPLSLQCHQMLHESAGKGHPFTFYMD